MLHTWHFLLATLKSWERRSGDEAVEKYVDIHYTPCSALLIRIHVLSGILNDTISADQAEEKFLTNIRLAADECAKVMNDFAIIVI